MIEIRTIEDDEAETFLTLLCDVFSLDKARARSVFFSEPFFDLRRKWALFKDGMMASILTTVPLEFGWGRAIGIAGVATRPELRGRGLAGELLRVVREESRLQGESAALLFARDPRLYLDAGFEVLDEAIYATLRPSCEDAPLEPLRFEEVRERYDRWAAADPDRLRRDDRRWHYWKWNLRVCNDFDGGYVCVEGNMVRECVVTKSFPSWPVGPARQWFGLASMARTLGAPIESPKRELLLMASGAHRPPQMFMTDQF